MIVIGGRGEHTQGERFFRMQGMLISVDFVVRRSGLPHLNRSLRSLFPSEIIYRFAFSFVRVDSYVYFLHGVFFGLNCIVHFNDWIGSGNGGTPGARI